MRKLATFLATIALAAASVLPASAQSVYPNKPVTVVVTFAAGGVTDVLARLYAQKLSARTGQQFLVENRVGAGGTIGTDFIARAKPDGYTLGVFLDSNTIAPALFAKLNSDPIKDFTPISMLATGAHIVVVHPSLPVNTLKELIDYAKANPGTPYASPAQGTAQHLGMEMIKLRAGVDLTHVPYKGGGQAINDVVGGQVKVAILGMAPVLQFLKSGQLKAIAVTGDKRTPLLPNVPTVSETLPGVSTLQWFGLVAPAGLPLDIVQKLHREVIAVSQDPEVEQRVAGVALETRISANPADLTRFMEQDLPKWPPLVKAAGLKRE
jgi:tripartite-type tricarboxylate transporter receptor subunit TctC